MKKIDVTWRLFSMYILIIVLTLLANAACGQIKVTQFNAKWNETIETAPRKYRDTGGWQNIEIEENFTHNNMVPFFGGSIKQNVEPYATSSHMEHFTGRGDTYRSKEEVNSMFTPEERAKSGIPF